jgi:hypothetical protein
MTIVLAALDVVLLCAFLAFVASGEGFWLPLRAKRRAHRLFLSKLSERQRRSWESNGDFEVTGTSGGAYTISSYGTFNIRNCGDEFCVLVEANIPVYDKLLAQRLLIEADENLFLEIANRRRRYKKSA